MKPVHCMHIAFVIGEHTDIFWCSEGVDFTQGEFSVGSELFADGISREYLTKGNSPEFLYDILFICVTVCLATQFCTRKCSGKLSERNFQGTRIVGVIFSWVWGVVYMGEFSRKKFSAGEFFVENIFRKGILHWILPFIYGIVSVCNNFYCCSIILA